MGLDGVVVRSTVNGLVTGRVYVGSVSLSYRRSGLLRSNTGLFSPPDLHLDDYRLLNDMCFI